jgi:hypothetical protein
MSDDEARWNGYEDIVEQVIGSSSGEIKIGAI